jgi:hypothetical protein
MTQIATTPQSTRRKMLRKQIYLLPQQDTKLKALAHQQRMTEAELIRQAVEIFLNQPVTNDVKHLPPNEAAWQEILASFEEIRKSGVIGEPHRWRREDYYDDSRYQRQWAK